MKATTALVGSLLLGGVSWVDCQSLKGTAEVLGAITEDREVRVKRERETDGLFVGFSEMEYRYRIRVYVNTCFALMRECRPDGRGLEIGE